MNKIIEFFNNLSDRSSKILSIIGLIIIFVLFTLMANGQVDHLKMLKNAPIAGLTKCEVLDDISFGICPYADRDTVYFSHKGLPPTHGAQEVIQVIDSVIVNQFKEKVNKVAIRRDTNYNLLLSYEYVDGIGGTLARATYPPCNDNIIQTIKYDLYDFPPGESVSEEIKVLYPDIRDIVFITKHELGHHWNLRHKLEQGNIMYSQYPKDAENIDWSENESNILDLMYKREFFYIIKGDNSKLTKNFRINEFYSRCNNGARWHLLYSKIPIVIQIIRDRFVDPIYLTSTYRNPVCNKRNGGVKTSAHLLGKAIDFRFASRHAHEQFILDIESESSLYYSLGKYGVTGIGLYDSHIHIDFKDRGASSIVVWDNRDNIIEQGHCPH